VRGGIADGARRPVYGLVRKEREGAQGSSSPLAVLGLLAGAFVLLRRRRRAISQV
jgi:MYXO-CTERM domain-containing protein